jgi:hypothetical protein
MLKNIIIIQLWYTVSIKRKDCAESNAVAVVDKCIIPEVICD